MSEKTTTEVKAFGPVGRSSVWCAFWAFGVRFWKPHRGSRPGIQVVLVSGRQDFSKEA